MDWLQALVLGIVEGVTEYLPVSSTGHLILVSWVYPRLAGLEQTPELELATNTFNIIVQAHFVLFHPFISFIN